MKQDEQERLETALRQVAPAVPPDDLITRINIAMAGSRTGRQPQAPAVRVNKWFGAWYRLTLAVPVAAVVLLWLAFRPVSPAMPDISQKAHVLKPNHVQVGHSLVASFDTVAEVPGAAPVRFHCREWEDNVVVNDDVHGVVISKTTPRVEIIPVRFETY